MTVVTISRELGSEGTLIARQAAEALHFHFVDKGTMEHVLHQYGFVDFKEVYDSEPGLWARFDTLRSGTTAMLDRTVKALARHGHMVIVGRGSFAVLKGYDDVLNVRIQAPAPVRLQRVAQRYNLEDEPDQAAILVARSDKVRSGFVEFSYGIRWDDASAFDLVVDTGKLTSDLAVRWLIEAVRCLDESTVRPDRSIAALQIDPVLAGLIGNVLNCEAVG